MAKRQAPKYDRVGVDRLGRTPLHYAASEGREVDAALQIESGADANARDDNGWTPLHFAAQSGALKIATLLLQSSAKVDALDLNGNSPLSNAVFSYKGDGALIEALRAAGADPLKENNYGESPVSLARGIANYDVKKFFADLP